VSEADLVARMREVFSTRIGDDAAIVADQVFTNDMLVEDVDFTRAIPLASIAHKSIAVNLSDIAAMGAKPQYLLTALALPEWADANALVDALAAVAKRYNVEIIGGDLSSADKLIISITAVGTIATRALLRSAAKPGERIYLSRPIGGSAAGLSLLQNGWGTDGYSPRQIGYTHRDFAMSAIRRQIEPEPEVDLGLKLATIAEVSACIDVSDGLSTDLHNLCDASQCGAEIDRERIPMFPGLLDSATVLGIRPRDAVLHGGEEYALLFTSTIRESELSTRLGRPVYAIGRITAGREIVLKEDGVPRPLERGGWDHFS
jgi:thiamine-monophosphate kinase